MVKCTFAVNSSVKVHSTKMQAKYFFCEIVCITLIVTVL